MANQNYEQKQSQDLSSDTRGNKAGQQASGNPKDQQNQAGQKQRQDQQQRPGMTRDEDEE